MSTLQEEFEKIADVFEKAAAFSIGFVEREILARAESAHGIEIPISEDDDKGDKIFKPYRVESYFGAGGNHYELDFEDHEGAGYLELWDSDSTAPIGSTLRNGDEQDGDFFLEAAVRECSWGDRNFESKWFPAKDWRAAIKWVRARVVRSAPKGVDEGGS